MSERVKMPALGESVTEGTVTRWLKGVGDRVELDEPLLEVSTDKVDTEIPSPVAGTLEQVLVHEDDTVPVGSDLAVIGEGADAVPDDGGSEAADAVGSAPAAVVPAASGSTSSTDAPRTANPPSRPAERAPAAEQAAEVQVSEPDQPRTSVADAVTQSAPPTGSTPSSSAGQGTVVPMPALGESVTEGTVTRWLKQVGDEVSVDEPLLEVSTDKVDTEIPSPVAGILTAVLAGEDDTVPVGADLAVVGGLGDPAAGTSATGTAAPAAASSVPSTQSHSPTPGTTGNHGASVPDQPAQVRSAPATAPAHQAAATPERLRQPARDQAPAPSSAPAPSRPAPRSDGASHAPGRPASDADHVDERDAAAYVTPLVRKLAADRGVDLGTVDGTGIGGRIRKQDVLAAADAADTARATAAASPNGSVAAGAAAGSAVTTPPPRTTDLSTRGTTATMTRLRRTIARRMVESLQVSAQLTTVVEVDVTRIARLRDRAKADFTAREGTKLSFLPFFALAAVEALKTHPMVNASLEGDDVTYHDVEHLGVAVDTEKGLLVPVLKNAGDLNIGGLARGISDVAERTRSGKIMPDDLAGGTFTITNTGSRGALFDTPIINQPQVAILGTGSVVRRPVVATAADGGETIAIRSMVYLALSYDHRLVDGADAARFLTAIKVRLEEGAFEADLGL
ncbi:MAG: 2-oxoglutarate dehydrogenase, E2 component, dihydrolipoamide succinyltransferase [Dermatophilaceae bacterium]